MDNTSNHSSSFHSSAHISQDTDSVCSCNTCQVRQKLNDVVSCIEKGLSPMEAVCIALSIRSFLYPDILLDFFDSYLLCSSEAHARISGFLPVSTYNQEEEYPTASVPDPNTVPAKDPSPELQIFCYYLLILNMIEEKRLDEAKECASACIAFIQEQSTVVNVDGIASKLYFYYSVFHEQKAQLAQIRGTLLALYRRAIQHHEELCRERLVNLLLSNYLHCNHYHQAEKFRAAAFQPRSHMQAIRDGIIDAKLDHANPWMISTTTEEEDVYATLEPQIAFDKRIAACLEIQHKLVREIKPPAKEG